MRKSTSRYSQEAEERSLDEEHQRNVAALYEKLQRVKRGDEWNKKRHDQHAMESGRVTHSTRGNRRRDQRTLASNNMDHMRRLRGTGARFATPSAIALLTGKPAPGAGGAGDASAESDE